MGHWHLDAGRGWFILSGGCLWSAQTCTMVTVEANLKRTGSAEGERPPTALKGADCAFRRNQANEEAQLCKHLAAVGSALRPLEAAVGNQLNTTTSLCVTATFRTVQTPKTGRGNASPVPPGGLQGRSREQVQPTRLLHGERDTWARRRVSKGNKNVNRQHLRVTQAKQYGAACCTCVRCNGQQQLADVH